MEINPADIGIGSRDDTKEEQDEESLNESINGLITHSEVSREDLTSPNNVRLAEPLSHIQTKRRRVRKFYNDQYLEFFSQFQNGDLASEGKTKLRTSQLGAVQWTSEEKDRLFTAVAKHGRHDLGRIADVVSSKSVIEIRAYLEAVRTALTERQLFMRKTKNVSLADIPAAIEIGEECEAALELAADALVAYQEQFDSMAGTKAGESPWLIDRRIAESIDSDNDAQEDAELQHTAHPVVDGVEQPEADDKGPKSFQLFHLSTMLDLSETIFMNRPLEDPHPHWTLIAEPEQQPAVTKEMVDAFFELVIGCTQRILKTSIHVARARLSSMRSTGYRPSDKLSQSDVKAALDILKMPHDAWEFWVSLARRNGFEVITGSHSKGESRLRAIPHETVEATLGPRRSSGRRRSMSVGSEASSPASGSGGHARPSSDIDDSHSVGKSEAGYDTATEDDLDFEISKEKDQDENSHSETGNTSQSAAPSEREADDTQNSRYAADSQEPTLSHDQVEEEYLEKVDAIAGTEEEKRLWQVLGKHPREDGTKPVELEVERRPKTLRKSREELQDWSSTLSAEWAYYDHLSIGMSSPAESSSTPALAHAPKDGLGG